MSAEPRVEFSPAARRRFEEIASRYARREGALLPALHLARCEWGTLSDEVVRYLGTLLEMPPARIRSVASFYPLFAPRPTGVHCLRVCTDLSCRLMGAGEVLAHLKEKLGVAPGQSSDDGRFALLESPCLASCGTAPVMMVGEELHQSLTRRRLEHLIARLP